MPCRSQADRAAPRVSVEPMTTPCQWLAPSLWPATWVVSPWWVGPPRTYLMPLLPRARATEPCNSQRRTHFAVPPFSSLFQSLQHLIDSSDLMCHLGSGRASGKCQGAKVSVSFAYIFICTISCGWSPGRQATGEISETMLNPRASVSNKRITVTHIPALAGRPTLACLHVLQGPGSFHGQFPQSLLQN